MFVERIYSNITHTFNMPNVFFTKGSFNFFSRCTNSMLGEGGNILKNVVIESYGEDKENCSLCMLT